MLVRFSFLIALCIFAQHTYADPECRNHANEAVDWFIALKFPGGARYAYCDSLNCDKLEIQSTLIDDLSVSPLFNTLRQVKNIKSDDYATLFWNDEPPTFDVSTTYAHAKGFIGTGKDKGFVVVHSTPKFPLIENDQIVMQIKSNQTIYGQHYFCFSTSGQNIDLIGAAYNIDWPYVYNGNVPSTLSNLAYLDRMLKNVRDNENQFSGVAFSTLGGVLMTKFAKSGKWVVPFYDNVPAQILQTGLIVESWRSSEVADCDQTYTVTNNLLVSFYNEVTFKETVDHSKYAISNNEQLPYVCLGDINRASTQWKRGGGTVCFSNKDVYKNFKSIMVQYQVCPSSFNNFWHSQDLDA